MGGGILRIYSVRDIYEFPPIEWLASYMLPSNGLGLLYGPSNIGKSFVALDLALSVATGTHFLNKRVRQGSVIYVAAGEGVPGQQARLKGWTRERGMDLEDAPIHFLTEAVQLHQPTEMGRFIDLIAEYSPKLVVFDTLARCSAGGNENSVEDTSKAIAACDRIREETDAAVVLVHHTGRPNEKGEVHERGSTALISAVDTSWEVQLPKGYEIDTRPLDRTLRCRKQKDADFFHPIDFHLKELYKAGRAQSLVPTPGWFRRLED